MPPARSQADLVPGQRRRDPGVRGGPHRVRRGHRPVLGVLVVVHEYAVPFFLPPLRGGQVWCPALDLPGQGHRCPADLGEVPAAPDPGVDVEPARAGCLWARRSARRRPVLPGRRALPGGSAAIPPPAPGPDRPAARRDARGRRPAGCGLRSMQPRLTAQDQGGGVPGTTSTAQRPDRKRSSTVSIHGRRDSAPALEERLALRAVHEGLSTIGRPAIPPSPRPPR